MYLENSGRFLKLNSGESLGSWLDGFTVRNGNINNEYGGAIYLSSSQLWIKNCIFENNYSNYGAGALYLNSTHAQVDATRFLNNNTHSSGGAVNLNYSTLTLEDADFHGNSSNTSQGSAVFLSYSNFNAKKIRFTNNLQKYQSYGAAIYASSSNLSLENGLFNRNISFGNYSDIETSSSGTYTLKNVTILNGISRNRISCKFSGSSTITLTNNIITGSVSFDSGSQITANHNCIVNDWSSYGSGNITVDPLLTEAGSLKAGSPCIDSGLAAGAPTTDINGIVRPFGSGVDMGCQEFKDSDGDGIPDYIELAAGLNPNDPSDAASDLDNDGLTNLQEYNLGTNPAKTDSDGDGINDKTELELGYNPTLTTRIIYVDANRPNNSGNGLTEETAKLTLKAAMDMTESTKDNVIRVKAGIYSGAQNRELSINGNIIKIYSMEGPKVTTIDLTGGYRFLSVGNVEKNDSKVAGFSFTNGNGNGSTIAVGGGGLEIRNCIFHNHNTSKNSYNSYSYDSPGIINVSGGSLSLLEVEINNCNLNDGNYVLYATGSSISMDKVRMSGNNSGSKETVFLQGSSLNMVNSLFLSNNNRSTGSIFRGDRGSVINGINCSFAYNTNGFADGFINEGKTNLLNCIVQEKNQTGTRTMNFCCSTIDYTALGEGNIAADPKMTSGGYLLPDSPCIDAGLDEGTPKEDIIGTFRPVGNKVDIGSEEFADLNNNGISDYYEAICGGELNPESDADNDGLSNLQEYQLGTDATNPDTDGDGMPDGWEVTHGFNPLSQADASEDADGDGLLNVEEYEAGTNPKMVDTDGDGHSDYWEVKESFSDPTTADFNGTEEVVQTINGNNFVSNTSWEAENNTAFARNRSGEIEYTLQIAQAGIYQLELEVQQHISNAATDEFQISCYIDGGISDSRLIKLGTNGIGKERYFTPMLTPGTHTVKLVWQNVYRNSILQINKLTLISLNGADSNGNGIPDWAENRLERMTGLILPAVSKVSPVCVEGVNASFLEQILISGYYVPAGEMAVTPEIKRAALNRWYTNLPLNPNGNNMITLNVTYQNSAKSVSKQVVWETTDVTTQKNITIRKDDSLRLAATLPNDYNSTFTIEVEGQEYTLNKGESMPHKFENTGNIPVVVSWTPSIGAPETRVMTVKVQGGTFNGEIVAFSNTSREWKNPGLGADPVVECDRNIEFTDNGLRGNDRIFTLVTRNLGKSYITARLYKDGPIMASSSITTIESGSHVSDGYHRIIQDFGDGTLLYDGYIVVNQVIPGLEVEVVLWGSNTTFDDGTRVKRFTSNQFDSNGELHYNVIAGRSYSTCQSIYLYQNGVMLKQLQ